MTNPKIEFRYLVEFKAYEPNPKNYEINKPLEKLNHDDLEAMAKFEPDNIYVEVVIGGTVFRRVKA